MQAAVSIRHISKTYRGSANRKAVDDVSLEVQQGEIFSLLGPNGAGKTTLISIVTGLFPPDPHAALPGDVWIMGHSILHDPAKAKTQFGLVPQEIALYETLTAQENLQFWGRMYGLSGATLAHRVAEVLEMVGLTDRAREVIEKYSGGMKRRINIAAALLHKPRVIIMDEPTVGIDPQSRRSILDGIHQLRAAGSTVLYTTHYMEEAQELSNHIAVMDHGQIIALGTHEELIELVGQKTRVELSMENSEEDASAVFASQPGVSSVSWLDGKIVLLTENAHAILPDLFEKAASANRKIKSVNIHEPNLEAVFLHLTGRALRDE